MPHPPALRGATTKSTWRLLHCVQLSLSHEEAAFVLAMPLGTVKTHATRGKAKLKAWLAAWNETATEEQTS